jgi:hypothetical protein
MSNLRIGYLNYADVGTLTATPIEATGSSPAYVQNDARGDVFLASSTASQTMLLSWGGTAYTIANICLWRLNLAYNDTVRFVGYSDAIGSAAIYDSGVLNAYTAGLFDAWGWAFINMYLSPAITIKSFGIVITSALNPLQYSRLYVGPYTEAPYNPNYGLILTLNSNSKQSRSEGGSLRAIAKGKWRELGFDMSVKTEADRAAWFEISRYCDIDKSFVASVFPGLGGTVERDHTIFGKFEKSPAMKLADVSRYDQSVRILEL